MAEFPIATNGIAQKLHKVAEALHPAETKVRAEVTSLAEKLQHAMEDWHAKVDAWLEDDASAELEATKKEAFALYRTLTSEAHDLLARLKARV